MRYTCAYLSPIPVALILILVLLAVAPALALVLTVPVALFCAGVTKGFLRRIVIASRDVEVR